MHGCSFHCDSISLGRDKPFRRENRRAFHPLREAQCNKQFSHAFTVCQGMDISANPLAILKNTQIIYRFSTLI